MTYNVFSGTLNPTQSSVDSENPVKQQYLLHMSAQCGELRLTNG